MMVAIGPATYLKEVVVVAMTAMTALGVARDVTIRAEAQNFRRK